VPTSSQERNTTATHEHQGSTSQKRKIQHISRWNKKINENKEINVRTKRKKAQRKKRKPQREKNKTKDMKQFEHGQIVLSSFKLKNRKSTIKNLKNKGKEILLERIIWKKWRKKRKKLWEANIYREGKDKKL
jgi:actin-related protein